MPVYMGGSHRTTDMSLTANKGRGRNDGKAVGRGKKRENNREREKKETIMEHISNKVEMHICQQVKHRNKQHALRGNYILNKPTVGTNSTSHSMYVDYI